MAGLTNPRALLGREQFDWDERYLPQSSRSGQYHRKPDTGAISYVVGELHLI